MSRKPSEDPHVLDEPLVQALEASERSIPESLRGADGVRTRRRNAALCFLYLYMTLSNINGKRYAPNPAQAKSLLNYFQSVDRVHDARNAPARCGYGVQCILQHVYCRDFPPSPRKAGGQSTGHRFRGFGQLMGICGRKDPPW
jgi:hypothetical protein